MKNLFLSVVLLLTVSFTFAVNDVEKDSTFDVTTVEMTNYVESVDTNFTIEDNVPYAISSEVEDAFCGFPLSWDTAEHGTGSFYFGCDNSTTMDDILSVIFELFW